MIKLIASDMDGTFLDEKGSFNKKRFNKILEKMESRGMIFVVASGNRMDRLELIFSGMEDQFGYVAENGALVIDKNEVLAQKIIKEDLIDQLLAYFEGYHKSYCLTLSGLKGTYVVNGVTFDSENSAISIEEMEHFFQQLIFLEDFKDRPKDAITKVTLMVDKDTAESISWDFNQYFQGNLRAVTSGFGAVDIVRMDVHKALGLQLFMDKYDISRDQVAAFGDGSNDIEMLQLAKYSFAMGNAPQNIKDLAVYEAPNNTDDGVLKIMEAILEGEFQ